MKSKRHFKFSFSQISFWGKFKCGYCQSYNSINLEECSFGKLCFSKQNRARNQTSAAPSVQVIAPWSFSQSVVCGRKTRGNYLTVVNWQWSKVWTNTRRVDLTKSTVRGFYFGEAALETSLNKARLEASVSISIKHST